jgi:hypothetical protein
MVMVIKYKNRGKLYATDCPHGLKTPRENNPIKVSGIFCADRMGYLCPYYSGPGPDPNTIICNYGEGKQ